MYLYLDHNIVWHHALDSFPDGRSAEVEREALRWVRNHVAEARFVASFSSLTEAANADEGRLRSYGEFFDGLDAYWFYDYARLLSDEVRHFVFTEVDRYAQVRVVTPFAQFFSQASHALGRFSSGLSQDEAPPLIAIGPYIAQTNWLAVRRADGAIAATGVANIRLLVPDALEDFAEARDTHSVASQS
jgi:hypothetical protein